MTTTHLHLDCASGVAGDMLLAALLDAGADETAVTGAVRSLFPDDSVTVTTAPVIKRGISARLLQITDTSDKTFRHWTTIRQMIEATALDAWVKERSLAVIRRIAEVEAAIHGVDMETVHFHEIGAVDTIVDAVGVVAALASLKVETVSCSAVNVGGGTVKIDHGTVPVPAPATAALAKGIPIYGSDGTGELATPTGMALLRELVDEFGAMPVMAPHATGYGAGRKDLPDANVVRAILGTRQNANAPSWRAATTDTILQIETNIDDQSPELVAGLIPRLLDLGAADAYLTPIVMKKGRAATLLTVLCAPARLTDVEALLFEETTTFGLRISEKPRIMLDRLFRPVETPYGTITVKLGIRGNRVVSAAPEYEDCKQAAERAGASVKQVMAIASAAAAAYLGTDFQTD